MTQMKNLKSEKMHPFCSLQRTILTVNHMNRANWKGYLNDTPWSQYSYSSTSRHPEGYFHLRDGYAQDGWHQ